VVATQIPVSTSSSTIQQLQKQPSSTIHHPVIFQAQTFQNTIERPTVDRPSSFGKIERQSHGGQPKTTKKEINGKSAAFGATTDSSFLPGQRKKKHLNNTDSTDGLTQIPCSYKGCQV
jgi:hypothetical protein